MEHKINDIFDRFSKQHYYNDGTSDKISTMA